MATNLNAQIFNVIHTFTNCPDGAAPYGGVLLDNGVLYGTTMEGGSSGAGVVFSLTLPPPEL
jgi:uncharacterized repeat protein (TIGR03803 family)